MNMGIPEITALGTFVLVAIVVFLAFRATKDRHQAAVRTALLERFNSAPDLGAFLQTSNGQRFLDELSSGSGNPLHSILTSVRTGIILMFVGAGFFPMSAGFKQGNGIVSGIGIVLALAGMGFLVSAVMTYLLSRWWGMQPTRSKAAEK